MSTRDARQRPTIVIDLDDDDELVDEDAQLHIDPRAPTGDAPGRVFEEEEIEVNPDDALHTEDDNSESDEYLDDMLREVIEAEEVEESLSLDQDVVPFEVCTPEETTHYRALLAQQGPDQFILHTVTAGKITPRKLCTAFGVPKTSLARLAEALDAGGDDGEDDEAATLNVWYRLLGLAIMRFVLTRHKLPEYNTIDDVAALLRKAKNILVITGAGISTNLGIPDFRSKDTGFYAKLAEKGFEDPMDVFHLDTFKQDPAIFFQHAGETFPTLTHASPTHGFIKLLQDKHSLLTNYTQNIDNVEEIAGIHEDKLIQCHGSWATATCLECKHQVRGVEIRDIVLRGEIPRCQECTAKIAESNTRPTSKRKRSANNTGSNKKRSTSFQSYENESDIDDSIPEAGVLKPDITFFGEQLPTNFFQRFKEHDIHLADLVLVIGTSMKVAPVSEIPLALPPKVPQIYVSKDPCTHIAFDVQLLGDCDKIMGELCRRAGWKLPKAPPGEVVLECRDEAKAWWDVSAA
jgi:NAD-dependent histone deacetylase SIR2